MKFIYSMVRWIGTVAVLISPFMLVSSFVEFVGILGFGLLLVTVAGIGLNLLEFCEKLLPKDETLDERKQRRWKEYEDSIRPTQES